MYHSFGVGCSEVEVDILTGERQILRCDILNDCGERFVPLLRSGTYLSVSRSQQQQQQQQQQSIFDSMSYILQTEIK